jgi:hypothetical protein
MHAVGATSARPLSVVLMRVRLVSPERRTSLPKWEISLGATVIGWVEGVKIGHSSVPFYRALGVHPTTGKVVNLENSSDRDERIRAVRVFIRTRRSSPTTCGEQPSELLHTEQSALGATPDDRVVHARRLHLHKVLRTVRRIQVVVHAHRVEVLLTQWEPLSERRDHAVERRLRDTDHLGNLFLRVVTGSYQLLDLGQLLGVNH